MRHHIATALLHWRSPNDCVTRVYGVFLHCGNIPKVSIAYTLHPNDVIFHFVIYTFTNSIAIIAFIHSKNDVCEFSLVTLENIFPSFVDHGDTIYIFPFSHLSTLGNSCSEAKTHKCSTPYLTMSTANRSLQQPRPHIWQKCKSKCILSVVHPLQWAIWKRQHWP